MTYGIVTGGSVSLHDLYALAEDVSQGNVSLPLGCETGVLLATQNGDGLLAVQKQNNYVEAAIASLKDEIMTAIMTGVVSLPLHTAAGEEMANQDGVTIAACKAVQ